MPPDLEHLPSGMRVRRGAPAPRHQSGQTELCAGLGHLGAGGHAPARGGAAGPHPYWRLVPPAAQDGAADGAAPAARREAVLEDVLRRTVISRLRLAHPEAAGAVAPGRRLLPGREEVEGFARALRFGSVAEVDGRAERLMAGSGGLAGMLLDVMPAVDARLHAETPDDSGALATLMLAEWRLSDLVERLGPRYQALDPAPRHARRAVLGTAEAQLFRLRLALTGEELTHAGWDVFSDVGCALHELPDLVHDGWFALVVIGADTVEAETLAAAIRGVRRASMNDGVRVLVLSAALARRPDRLMRLGADAACADVRQAAAQAGRLLSLMAGGR